MAVRLLTLLILVSMTGCGIFHPGIQGSGISRSEFRDVEPFEEVILSGFGRVNVSPGDRPSICVTTDDNLLAHVDTHVINGMLHIDTHGNIKPRTGLNVDVTVPSLTAARVSGAGDLNINQVMGEQLDLSVSGAGNLVANGHVNKVTTSISGAGDVDLRELHAVEANVRVSGAGDADVYASQSIKARISGAGNVVCFGNPIQVDQRISGAGDFELISDEASIDYTDDDDQDWR